MNTSVIKTGRCRPHDLVPGGGVGPFLVGTPVNEVVEVVQGSYGLVKVEELGDVDKWKMEIPDAGLRLYLDGVSQRLVAVEIYDSSRLCLVAARGVVFEGSHKPPTYAGMYEAFGPTVDSTVDEKLELKPLMYPGMLVLFGWKGDVAEKMTAAMARSLSASSIWIFDRKYQLRSKTRVMDIGISLFDILGDAANAFHHKSTITDQHLGEETEEARVDDVERHKEGRHVSQWSDTPLMIIHLGSGVYDAKSGKDAFEASMVYFDDSPQDVLHVLGDPDEIHRGKIPGGAMAPGVVSRARR